MKVSEWIKLYPCEATTVSPDAALEVLVDLLLSKHRSPHDIYVVDENCCLLGYISHRKVLRLYLLEQQPVHTRRQILERVTESSAGQLMEKSFPRAALDADIESLLHMHLEHEMREMPVVDEDNRLIGAIDILAVVKSLRKFDRIDEED